MEIETQCLYAGYSPKNGEPQTLPICQSTTFKYESTEQVSKLFDLEEAGFFYTRLGNPTVDAVEQKIAMLEGGVGALCTASGQAAPTFSILTLAAAGDHIVSSSAIYGGSLNLFAVTLKRLGIEVTFVSPEASEDEIQAAFRPNTKALFGETIANPSIEVLDIEKFARIAHRNGVPLIVDNTFATPVLCRPIEFGADIVVHSTTKYMDCGRRHLRLDERQVPGIHRARRLLSRDHLYAGLRQGCLYCQGAYADHAGYGCLPDAVRGLSDQSGA